jgi:hypothetical protein
MVLVPVVLCVLGVMYSLTTANILQPHQTEWIVQNVLGPEYRIHEAITDGHGDAVFAILKARCITVK